MLPYWLLYGYFAVASMFGSAKTAEGRTQGRPFLVLGAIIIIFMVGLRFRVGADWNSYQYIFDAARYASFERLLSSGDPGYQVLNWFTWTAGMQVWGVNLVAALVFTWGLVRLATAQPYPWLGMLVAIPYLVIVVAMGYTRQAMALGFIMAGLANFSRGGSIARFIFYVALAGLFHRTAILVVPFAAFVARGSKWVNVALIAIAAPLLYYSLLSNHVDDLINAYVKAGYYSSSGAAIRMALCVVPALSYFFFRSRMKFTKLEMALWRNFALATLVALVFLLTTTSATAVDRFSLYLLPLQIAVYSRLPFLLKNEFLPRLILAAFGAFILFVWLNYASNSDSWLPYRYFSPFG